MTTAATYRKTKTGAWVVFAPHADLLSEWITVTKKDGTTKREHIESVGRPFTVDGVRMANGYLPTRIATINSIGKPRTTSGVRIDMGYGRTRTHRADCGCRDCIDEMGA